MDTKTKATNAAFYMTPAGELLRMDFVENNYFQAHCEDTGEVFEFYFSELIDEPEFYGLARI